MPVRIEVSWQRMLELISDVNILEITEESDLNDFFCNGRTNLSCHISTLNDEEISRLHQAGFTDYDSGEICLICEKETYPGKYFIGEF